MISVSSSPAKPFSFATGPHKGSAYSLFVRLSRRLGPSRPPRRINFNKQTVIDNRTTELSPYPRTLRTWEYANLIKILNTAGQALPVGSPIPLPRRCSTSPVRVFPPGCLPEIYPDKVRCVRHAVYDFKTMAMVTGRAVYFYFVDASWFV